MIKDIRVERSADGGSGAGRGERVTVVCAHRRRYFFAVKSHCSAFGGFAVGASTYGHLTLSPITSV